MMNFFVGNNLNNPRVMIAFQDPNYYNDKIQYEAEYTGKGIVEVYSFEYLRDVDKWLKKESELNIEEPISLTQFFMVDLKTNTTICTGMNFPSSYKIARKRLKEYYSDELSSTKKLQKYVVNVRLSGQIEVEVEARNYEEAASKALEESYGHKFTNEDVYMTTFEPFEAIDEDGNRHMI